MAHPMKHAESSGRQFGGQDEDYLRVHDPDANLALKEKALAGLEPIALT